MKLLSVSNAAKLPSDLGNKPGGSLLQVDHEKFKIYKIGVTETPHVLGSGSNFDAESENQVWTNKSLLGAEPLEINSTTSLGI